MYKTVRKSFGITRSGLTMIEVVISTALTGMLTIGALSTVGAVAKTRSMLSDRLMAQDLAQHLMTEILQRDYTDPEDPDPPIGLDTEESDTPRSSFDDVDDFNGWNAMPPVDASGDPIPDYAGWRHEAFVSWIQPGTMLHSGTETGLKKIRVVVTNPSGHQHEIVSLRTAQGAGEQLPVQDATVITWVEGRLKIGVDTPATLSGTNLVNHANDE